MIIATADEIFNFDNVTSIFITGLTLRIVMGGEHCYGDCEYISEEAAKNAVQEILRCALNGGAVADITKGQV